MSDPFVGEIRMFGCNFAPRGWAMCQGQLLPITQNTALFSLLGTYYGGNGTSNFALPNLQGLVPVGTGQGPGLQGWYVGQMQGSASVTLASTQIPAHAHALQAVAAAATTADPGGAALAMGTGSGGGRSTVPYYQSAAPNVAMSASAVAPAGGSSAHNNMMPYLSFNYCIALQGVFPPRQ